MGSCPPGLQAACFGSAKFFLSLPCFFFFSFPSVYFNYVSCYFVFSIYYAGICCCVLSERRIKVSSLLTDGIKWDFLLLYNLL